MYNIKLGDTVWISNYPYMPFKFYKCKVLREIETSDPIFGNNYELLLEDGMKLLRAARNIYHSREEAQRCLARKLNKLQPT